MTTYQKIWGTVVSVFLIIFVGLLIWAEFTTDSTENINQVLQSCDTTNVMSIAIVPYNPDWKINLTADTVTIRNRKDINDLLSSLKSMTKKHFPKGTKTNWDTFVIINFEKAFNNKLKDKSKLTFHIYDSQEGLYAERQNVMGYTTYFSNDLKTKLEKLTDYHFPRERNN